ncbi:tetratricopeptide (TPR) repeat protein [Flavobacterium nitrogenifigens]|uniref:Tetratricopeptide (TPR) repeat protein n=2 Tax=Flavobacterium TaxID=237 RepID=A0A7W7J1P1_9FLAO|nr:MULTISPECIES: hypothetical protein [Flavobacterium]MBB4804253.1 tetratricopeptide (TPR) repeat protein [Flavobacterium nitrogenifigens]MBB6389351.1 tetratricopeptide (TPR) repeat protein [Flavobacterium notoginsengisoli]
MKISLFIKISILIYTLLLVTSCEKKKEKIVAKIDNTAEIKRLTIIADADFDKNEYEKAYKNYQTIVQLSDPEKNRIDYVDALVSIALIQQFEGNYLKSEITATKILPHLKYLKKPRFAWETYKIFSDNYLATKDYENALIYAKKAYALNASPRRDANALANIALVYMHLGEHKKAIEIYKKVTTTGYYGNKNKANTLEGYELMDYGIMISNIGISSFQLHDPKTIDYFNEALKIRLKSNDRQKLPDSYSNLSDYYLDKNLPLAKKYAETAYKLACEINIYSAKRYAMLCLIRTSEGNDLKKYTNLYINFTDSMTKSRLIEKNQFANIKYNFKKDIDENLRLKTQKAENELQLERQKNRSYILYFIIIISIFSLVFIVFHITAKGKREKNIAAFKSELRISQKLRAELTNEVLMLFTKIQNSNIEISPQKEELLNSLDHLYAKTRKISKENSIILTDEHYVSGLKEMISDYANSNLNIIINGINSISWTKIDRIKKITVFRIFQELFENIQKNNNASLVSINFKKDEKNIEIIYIDNSTEIKEESIKLKKRLQNVENRIKTIKGTLNFESNQESGFKISFTFPL